MVDKFTQMWAMKQVSIIDGTYSSSANTTKGGNNNTNSALHMIFQYIKINIVPVHNVSLLLQTHLWYSVTLRSNSMLISHLT